MLLKLIRKATNRLIRRYKGHNCAVIGTEDDKW
jgi:hypothetical protein